MSKEKPNINSNSDKTVQDSEVHKYGDYIKQEIIRETFLKSDNSDTERIAFLVKELNRVNPPKDIDADKALQEFYEKYDVSFKKSHHRIQSKRIICLAAAIIIIAMSSIVAVGHKLNWFNLHFDRDKNTVRYSQDNTGEEKPEALNEASETIIVNSLDEALLYIPFSPILPQYIPNEMSIDIIQINNISDKLIDLCIDYCDINGKNDLSIYINYNETEQFGTISQSYETDYELDDRIKILGQDCIVSNDGYNHNCSFTFDKTVYSISASKNISLSEFKKILASINF